MNDRDAEIEQLGHWQSIETAPKDGSQFLVTDGECVVIAEWPDALHVHDCTCHGVFDNVEVATHWQPLPPTPSAPPALASKTAATAELDGRDAEIERDDREVEDIERLASQHSVLHWSGILRIIKRMRAAKSDLARVTAERDAARISRDNCGRALHEACRQLSDARLTATNAATQDDTELRADDILSEMIEVAVAEEESQLAAEWPIDCRAQVDKWQAALQPLLGHANGFSHRDAREVRAHCNLTPSSECPRCEHYLPVGVGNPVEHRCTKLRPAKIDCHKDVIGFDERFTIQIGETWIRMTRQQLDDLRERIEKALSEEDEEMVF